MYSYLSYFGYKHGRNVMQGFWEAVDRHGMDRNPYRAGFLQLVAISDTDAKAEAEYAAHADYFYNRCLHVFEGFADAPGYRTQATLRKGFRPQVGAHAMQVRQGLTWKDFVDKGYIIAGSPATVRDRLKEVAAEMNVGHLMTLCHFGSMPRELTMQNTELFAQHVLPELKTMWSDWDDKWWPQPLATAVQPAPLATA
jgi:alkanesulfonate monooxygenase SsuD/methylene tetrahydromethanopterin reductase-like flavin-dependent oxidoreductase (luciferase family)